MATPALFVAEYEVASWGVNTSPRTVSVTTAVGDRLVVLAVTEQGGTTLATPTGGSLTYTLQQSVNPGASFTRTYIWTATATAAATFNVSITSTGSDWWGFTVLRFSGSNGFGASAGGSGTGAPSLALTTTQPNSTVITVVGDWNADPGARTWRTINSITPTSGNGLENVYAATANYVSHAARWNDVGAAGSKTTGLTQPTGQKYTIASIELFGSFAPAPTFVAEAETVFNTTTTPKTLSIDTQIGDVIVAVGMGSNWSNSGSDLAISGGGLTWTQQQANTANSFSQHHVWTAVATAATTFNISVTNPTGSGGNPWGFSYTQWRNSGGVGASNKASSASGVPSVGLTTTAANSAIVFSNTDWVPVNGSTRAYLSINSLAPTEHTYFFDAAIGTFYVASYPDAGAAGAKTAGLSTPGGQKYVAIAVEVLGASSAQNIAPSSIASAEAFGTAVVSNANTIAPTGIASGEAFGTATITAANTITPGGIASAEAFGTATVTTTNTITPSGIGSAEAFGTATISTANTIAPTGIGSAEAFGTATVSAANDIAPPSIGSAEAFGTATITTSNEILPTGIGSAEAFGNAVVALQGTQIIAPPSIGSAEAFGTATISTAATIAPTGIASAEAFGTATVGSEATISPGGIGSAEAFGLPTVSAGEVVISPAGIPSAEAFGTPTVTDSSLGQIIAPIGIPSGERFGQPYVWIHLVRACDCSVLVDD